MIGWSGFVGLLEAALAMATQVTGGSLGGGILLLSLGVRVSLLPVTLKLAQRALDQRELLRRVQPQIEKLRRRYGKDPGRLMSETQQLHREHGIRIPDPRSLGLGIAQAPLLLGVFTAVRNAVKVGGRFLWIRDLARPDLLLSCLVAGLASVAVAAAPNANASGRAVLILLPTVLTFLLLSRLAAGVAIYWGAINAVATVQAIMLRRTWERDR